MRNINKFFEALSERLWDENYLSDVTYALLKTDTNFKEIFFNFCFGEKSDDIDLIEREYKKGNSKSDFHFINYVTKKEYILEIKIGDKDIHKKYKRDFSKAKKSFIANYEARGKPYYAEKIYDNVNTWYKFIPCLQNKIKNISNNKLLFGYLTYIKKLTDFVEAKSMNLSNTISLIAFNQLLDKIIKNDSLLSVNNKKDSCGDGYFGKNIEYKKQKKTIEFWFGVYWEDKPGWVPYVTIKCEKFNGKLKGKNYFTEDSDKQYIYLSDDLNIKLNSNKEKIVDQEKILKKFLTEFLNQL